ncbi:hypothetical protein ABPG74_004868 [Tetrahymena malaccensis]
MRLNIQKLNFEKTQKMHNEMVEIFHSRTNDKSLTEDDNGTKNISTNRIQSSFQEISSKQLQQQEANLSTKIANIVQQIDNKKRLKYQNEGSQIQNNQIEKIVSPSCVQNPVTSYSDVDNQKQEQTLNLQDSLSISVQNDQKSFVNQFQMDQENKCSNEQDQFLDNSGLQLNFASINPTFRNNNQCSQSDNTQDKNVLQLNQNIQMHKQESSENKQREIEFQERSQSAKHSGDKSKQLNLKEPDNIFDNSKFSSQNQSQLSNRVNEQQNKKQKQSMTSQFGSRKKESKKLTENEKQITQKKQKTSNFIHIIMKMRNYAYKMASNVESKRLAILQRQNFFYFRDKTINYEKQEKEDFEFYDYNFFQRNFRLILDMVFYVQNLDIMLVTVTTLDIFINLNTVQYRKVVGKMNQNEGSIMCAQQYVNSSNIDSCTFTWLDKLKGSRQILSEMHINSKEYDEHFNAIYGFMHKKNISTDLQVQVREYLQYFFIQSNQEDIKKQQKVIQLLPDALQNQIMLDANKIVFENSPLFRTNFSEQIIQKTIKIIEQREYIPGQNIQMQDVESDSCIYFIEKGRVEIYNNNNNEEIKLLHKGQQFGEIQFFTGQTSKISVRSIEFTKLLAIKRVNFLEIIQSSPSDLEKFCMIKDSILYSNKLDMVGLSCYCCKSSSHLVTQCSFIHLQPDKYRIIKEYVKDNIQNRDKDIQRRPHSYNTIQLKDQIEEDAKLFVEENIDDLCCYGWFNDLIQQEFQSSLFQFKQSTGYPSHASLKTLNQNNQNLQDQQIIKNIQNFQNQFANKKMQYQKIKNMIDIQSGSSYPELNPSVANSQQKSYNNFQNAYQQYSEEQYSQSPQAAGALNINKKVQFSINSLQDNIQEDSSGDCKSLYNQQCQFSQFIKQQSHPNNYLYNQIQISGTEQNILNTPTNRQRQLSNISEMNHSPYSAANNLQVNLNSANYYHSYQNNPNNNYSVNNNSIFQYAQQSNYNIPEIVNQQYSQESSRQLSNFDTYSQNVKRNSNEDNNLYAKFMNQSKLSTTQYEQKQKQQEIANLRNNKKKSTLKTEHINKRKSIRHLQMSKQLSSVYQRQTNEALIKQLKELVQIPQNLTLNQDFQFDALKNYQIYMPQNNCDRVLLLYSVFMRKNQPILSVYKTKKSINKNEDIQQINEKPQKQNSRKSIQHYKNLLKQNQEESNSNEESKSSKQAQ